MLFQTDIDKINTEIAQLQESIAAKQQHQSQLVHLQNLADEAVKSVQNVICLLSSSDARVTLKLAVVSLFDGINDSGSMASTLSTSALVSIPESAAVPEGTPALFEEDFKPESAAEPAPPATLAAALEPELIQVTERVSYMREANGEIRCIYIGFSNKGKAQSWGEWLTKSTVASGESYTPGIAYKFEVKPAVQLPFKYELLVWGLNLNQVNQLASQDFSKTPKVESEKTVEGLLKDTSSATREPVVNAKVTGHIDRPIDEQTLPTATPSKVAPKLERKFPRTDELDKAEKLTQR